MTTNRPPKDNFDAQLTSEHQPSKLRVSSQSGEDSAKPSFVCNNHKITYSVSTEISESNPASFDSQLTSNSPKELRDRREYMRRYQRKWIKARRLAWLNGRSCEWCGSVDRLEVDHIDPELKITHNVWSWSEHRRDSELAKCRVLCYGCHKVRHESPHGAIRRYNNGCRCKLCKEAKAREHRKYRSKKLARIQHVVREAWGGAGRVELPTAGLEIPCSIQLSYAPTES